MKRPSDSPNNLSGSPFKIDTQTLRRIDQTALTRSGKDAALWYHHKALLEGQWFASKRKSDLAFLGNCTKLAQYGKAEESVIGGWRKFLRNTLSLEERNQSDEYAINRGIIFNALSRAANDREVSEILQERAQSIEAFASRGDMAFFRSLGRKLTNRGKRDAAKGYACAYAVLSHWLMGYLWLMPEILASSILAGWDGRHPKTSADSDKELRHFREIKSDYSLKSHDPTLIQSVETDGKVTLTPEGRNLFLSSRLGK